MEDLLFTFVVIIFTLGLLFILWAFNLILTDQWTGESKLILMMQAVITAGGLVMGPLIVLALIKAIFR